MTERQPAVVLLSGGQDSTTCLFWAMQQGAIDVHALSFDYGQRHATELLAAAEIARMAGVRSHHVIDLRPVLRAIGDSALVDPTQNIRPSGGYIDEHMPEGLPTSFVPGRNALFLTVAASVAVKVGAHDIVTGVCETDFSGYPDCRAEFVRAMEHALELAMPSSTRPLDIRTPLMHLDKRATVLLAHNLGQPCWDALARTVTCYHGKRPGCGTCPACVLRARGFAEAELRDPAAG